MSKRIGIVFTAPQISAAFTFSGKVGTFFSSRRIGMSFKVDVLDPVVQDAGYGNETPFGNTDDSYGFVGLERK